MNTTTFESAKNTRRERAAWAVTGTAVMAALMACGGSGGSSGGGYMSPPPAKPYYAQVGLVSDQAGGATHIDSNLVNPWGLAYGPQTYFWTANNRTGTSTVYNGGGIPMPATPIVVSVPPASGGTTGSPTGVVFNGTTDFMADKFIFATEDGTISGWSTGTAATLRKDNSASGAVYKGLAMGAVGTANYLYATDFSGGRVDVFDASYAPVNLGATAFMDPTLPSDYSPFGIQTLGTKIYVAYAKRVAPSKNDTPGLGFGYVSVFNSDGTFVQRLVSQGYLNAPWGMALAPANFGNYSGALLVGNFGDGHINAYNLTTGAQLGQLSDVSNQALSIDGLWAIAFGNDALAGKSNELYFTAGPQGQAHGLFGSISASQNNTGGGGTGGGGY